MSVIIYKDGVRYDAEGEHFMGSDVQRGYINNHPYEYYTPPDAVSLTINYRVYGLAHSLGNIIETPSREYNLVSGAVTKTIQPDKPDEKHEYAIGASGTSSVNGYVALGCSESWIEQYTLKYQVSRTYSIRDVHVVPSEEALEKLEDITKWGCYIYWEPSISYKVYGNIPGRSIDYGIDYYKTTEESVGHPGQWVKLRWNDNPGAKWFYYYSADPWNYGDGNLIFDLYDRSHFTQSMAPITASLKDANFKIKLVYEG